MKPTIIQVETAYPSKEFDSVPEKPVACVTYPGVIILINTSISTPSVETIGDVIHWSLCLDDHSDLFCLFVYVTQGLT